MRFRVLFVNSALVVIAVMASLLIVEGVLRFWSPFEYRVKGDRIVLPVNETYEITLGGGNGLDPVVRHSKNALGFRGPEPPADFDDAVTALAVGGSTTESFYQSQGRSWPELFGAAMGKILAPTWMNNAGLDGHSSFGHLVLLEDYIVPMKPDIVLFLVGWNDQRKDAPGTPDRRNLRGWTGGGTPRQWMYAIANRSEVAGLALNLYRSYKTWRMGVRHDATFFDWDAEFEMVDVPESERRATLAEHAERYVPGFRERMERIVEVALGNGIRPVLVTQPTVYGRAVDPRTGTDMARIRSWFGNGALAWDVVELYNDATRAVAREAGVPLVDLAREMPKDSTYFYDTIHFNNAGAAKVADILIRALCPWLQDEFAENVTGSCPAP